MSLIVTTLGYLVLGVFALCFFIAYVVFHYTCQEMLKDLMKESFILWPDNNLTRIVLFLFAPFIMLGCITYIQVKKMIKYGTKK